MNVVRKEYFWWSDCGCRVLSLNIATKEEGIQFFAQTATKRRPSLKTPSTSAALSCVWGFASSRCLCLSAWWSHNHDLFMLISLESLIFTPFLPMPSATLWFLTLWLNSFKQFVFKDCPFFIDMERLTWLVSLIFRRQPVKGSWFRRQLRQASFSSRGPAPIRMRSGMGGQHAFENTVRGHRDF